MGVIFLKKKAQSKKSVEQFKFDSEWLELEYNLKKDIEYAFSKKLKIRDIVLDIITKRFQGGINNVS